MAFGCASLLLGEKLVDLLTKNTLGRDLRVSIAVAMCLGLVAPIAAVLFAAFRSKQGVWEVAQRISRLALPLVPLAAYPSLLAASTWARQPLNFLLLLVLFGFGLERALITALTALPTALELALFSSLRSALERSRRGAFVTVFAAASAYTAYTAYLTILNHYRFGTGAYDLAIFDNLMFNALKGEPFRSTVMFGARGGNSLCTHAEYAMLLFTPLYALFPRAEALLVLQAAMLGFAAVPLYLFASTQLRRWQALLIALLFLLFAPLHGAEFYDFHWLPVSTFFVFLLFWAIATYRNKLVLVTVLILFALREDLAPGLCVVGLFLLLSGNRPRLGLALALIAPVWFAVNKFVIMPAMGKWWFEALYKDLVAPGEQGWGSIITTIVMNPVYVLTTVFTEAKLEYALHLFAPFVFLPLRRPQYIVLFLPGFLVTMLTTGYGAATDILHQYTTHWIPYLFGSFVLVVHQLQQQSFRRAVAALATVSLVLVAHSNAFGVVLSPSVFRGGVKEIRFSLTADERQRYGELRELIDLIPPEASVSVTDFEAPHLSNRRDVFALAQEDSAGDYLLLHTDSFKLARTVQNIRKIMAERRYGLVKRIGKKWYLYKVGHESPETEGAIQQMFRQQ